jgi:hypothetical protein
LTALLDVLLHENRTLERLYLGGNEIDAEGALQLAALLRANPAIKALLLSVNHLGDPGILALADALRENSTLEELGLASNGITAEGGAALFQAAQTHPTLTHLDFSCSPSTRVLAAHANALGDTGAKAAGRFLADNSILLRLDLRHNGITEAGKACLVSGLKRNTTLRHLLLDGKPDPRVMVLLERNREFHESPDPPISRDVALIRSVYRTIVPKP